MCSSSYQECMIEVLNLASGKPAVVTTDGVISFTTLWTKAVFICGLCRELIMLFLIVVLLSTQFC